MSSDAVVAAAVRGGAWTAQLTEEQLNVLTQRVLQLRHDVVSTRQLLEHLRDDNEAAGDSIIALDELFEKSEHFSIWLTQIAVRGYLSGRRGRNANGDAL